MWCYHIIMIVNKGKKKNKETWKYIKKCIPYFLIKKKELIILLVLSIVIALTNSFIPALIGNTLDLATSGKIDDAIEYLVFILFIVSFFNYLSNSPLTNSYNAVQHTVINEIRKDVISAYYNIDNTVLIKTPSGVFLTRITEDPSNITSAFNTLRENIGTILSNIFVIFYITYINWVLGLIVLIGTIVIYMIEKEGMNRWNEYRKRRNIYRDKNTSVINEGIRGVHDIKLLNITQYFKDKIFFNMGEMYKDDIKSSKIDARFTFLREETITIFTAIILILAMYFAKFNFITIGSIITLYMYKDRLFKSILYIAWSERHLKEFLLSAKRIFEVIDEDTYPKEVYGNKRINNLHANIEFKNVHFSYGKNDVLKGVNFDIKEKETVAIVGKSGSGKTTIINLLDKLYKVSSGKILVDGCNINDLDKYTIRNNISVIPQSPYLFNVTIKENLKMVCSDANQKQIENVCKICEIHDYIMTLPKKYNTLIGEGGVNLSGGEKQRLAIARALLMDTKIILFDEATSALDNETQANIQKAINNISSEYTMLIIAHRLSTIKDCNKIIVIDDGKVIGIGNHKELYSSNIIYKNLYEKELQK